MNKALNIYKVGEFIIHKSSNKYFIIIAEIQNNSDEINAGIITFLLKFKLFFQLGIEKNIIKNIIEIDIKIDLISATSSIKIHQNKNENQGAKDNIGVAIDISVFSIVLK